MPIRVTVEIVPHGIESRKFTVGVAEIENDLSSGEFGNYDLTISGAMTGTHLEHWGKGRLEGFDRTRGPWECVKEALNKLPTTPSLTSPAAP